MPLQLLLLLYMSVLFSWRQHCSLYTEVGCVVPLLWRLHLLNLLLLLAYFRCCWSVLTPCMLPPMPHLSHYAAAPQLQAQQVSCAKSVLAAALQVMKGPRTSLRQRLLMAAAVHSQ
jgi:cytochrome c biogenesis protein CcdA